MGGRPAGSSPTLDRTTPGRVTGHPVPPVMGCPVVRRTMGVSTIFNTGGGPHPTPRRAGRAPVCSRCGPAPGGCLVGHRLSSLAPP